jgi:hypothetical protein
MSGDVSAGNIVGDLAATDAPDIAALDGTVAWLLALSASEAADTPAMGGTVAWLLVLSATEALDVASMSGDNGGGGSPPTYRPMGYHRIGKGIGIGL